MQGLRNSSQCQGTPVTSGKCSNTAPEVSTWAQACAGVSDDPSQWWCHQSPGFCTQKGNGKDQILSNRVTRVQLHKLPAGVSESLMGPPTPLGGCWPQQRDPRAGNWTRGWPRSGPLEQVSGEKFPDSVNSLLVPQFPQAAGGDVGVGGETDLKISPGTLAMQFPHYASCPSLSSSQKASHGY